MTLRVHVYRQSLEQQSCRSLNSSISLWKKEYRTKILNKHTKHGPIDVLKYLPGDLDNKMIW
jgi:hypothetical protein